MYVVILACKETTSREKNRYFYPTGYDGRHGRLNTQRKLALGHNDFIFSHCTII
jgi:hypothetical protein